MGRKVIVCVMTICLLGISSVQASEGWIYNAGRIAYYSTALESETDGFYTWTGETWNGRVHGYGIQTFYSDDGQECGYYEGYMDDGYREGYGRFSWAGISYKGGWHLSRYHGKGYLKSASSQYLGNFVNGEKEGRGVLIGDGVVMTGQFVNDRFNEYQELSQGYFIIGLCTRNKEAAVQEATENRKIGHHPMVVYSSDWSNLAPGWYMVVYGDLANEDELNLLDGFKFYGGFDYYIKYSGDRKPSI